VDISFLLSQLWLILYFSLFLIWKCCFLYGGVIILEVLIILSNYVRNLLHSIFNFVRNILF
jgi:hypothetical protein